MNFLSYLLLFMLGVCTLIFGVLGLFVTRILSPICKTVEPYFHAINISAIKRNSILSKKDLINKQNAEDVSFEEVK